MSNIKAFYCGADVDFDDVVRITKGFMRLGYIVSGPDCVRVWEDYLVSNQIVTWHVPNDIDEIVEILLKYVDRLDIGYL